MTISNKLAHRPIYDPGDMSFPVILNANESYLQPSPALLSELTTILQETPLNRYPDPFATALCRAFADFYGIDAKGIVCGNGSDELIHLLFECLLDPGQAVLTLQPDFSMYGHYAFMKGVREVQYEKDSDRLIDINRVLEIAKQENVALILFSNPCNPTSVGLEREEVLQLVRAFSGVVVVDEAYMDFWNQSVLADVSQHDNLIVLRTASKALALAALRVGFAVMPEALAQLLYAGKSPYNVGALVQRLGEAVYRSAEELRANIATLSQETADLGQALADLLAGVPGIRLYDSKSNFFYIETADAERLYRCMMRDGVLVRYFKPNGLRVCCGAKEENRLFLAALDNALKEG